MDIGSGTWVRQVDGLAHNISERLSLEGTVLSQRAKELRSEAIKVLGLRAALYSPLQCIAADACMSSISTCQTAPCLQVT